VQRAAAVPCALQRQLQCCGGAALGGQVRREPPYELLTINKLDVSHEFGGLQALLDMASALTVYKDALDSLHVYSRLQYVNATLNALVDAAISAGIKSATLKYSGLMQAPLPVLTRLLQSTGFERLAVWNRSDHLEEGEEYGQSWPVFSATMRKSERLKELAEAGGRAFVA